MKAKFIIPATFAAIALTTTALFSAGDGPKGPHDAAINARKAQMQLFAFNLGQLGAMAKGNMGYDAGVAQAAAGNLAALAGLDPRAAWPEGSDNESHEGTRALPAIWTNFPDVETRLQALADAAAAMQAAAGTDLAALQGAMGALGGVCGGCHKAYRQPQ